MMMWRIYVFSGPYSQQEGSPIFSPCSPQMPEEKNLINVYNSPWNALTSDYVYLVWVLGLIFIQCTWSQHHSKNISIVIHLKTFFICQPYCENKLILIRRWTLRVSVNQSVGISNVLTWQFKTKSLSVMSLHNEKLF